MPSYTSQQQLQKDAGNRQAKVPPSTALTVELRRILGEAYTFIRSRQLTDAISTISYEELLELAIRRVEGTDGESMVRTPKIKRVQQIKTELLATVDTVMKVPPEHWAIETDEAVSDEDNANPQE
jgi:hypothetical protein